MRTYLYRFNFLSLIFRVVFGDPKSRLQTLLAKKFGRENLGCLIFGQFLTHFRQILDKHLLKINLRLQNTNCTETTSVKMIVLLQPQGFTETPTSLRK